MVIIGYQGVGKSTLAKKLQCFLDLESSAFKINGKRADDWYKPYGNIALNLSQQGYYVCTSSHIPLIEWIGTQNPTREMVTIVHPAFALKDQWIERLQKRYDETQLQKDYIALMNAKDRYIDNIQELIDEANRFHFNRVTITSMDYNLLELLSLGDHALFHNCI